MSLEVVSLALGAYGTNCYVVAREGAGEAVVIDPGDSPELVLQELAKRGWSAAAILVTHGHLDHIGAVRSLAEATPAFDSWWVHWRHWLVARSGEKRPAPAALGNDRNKPGADAPGTYVTEP